MYGSRWRIDAGLVLAYLVWVGQVSATPPVVNTLTPRGAERGKTVEVVIAGANLTGQTKLLLPFKAAQALIAEAKPNPAQARINVTVDAATPAGVYPVRVMTEDGISSLVLFSVDVLPSISEIEDNNAFERAQKIATPVIVTGQINANDIDHFRFTARKDQRLILEVESTRLGSGIDPCFRVIDANRRFMASVNDSPGLQRDCRLVFTAPEDGDYIVEVHDAAYRANPPPHYRLKLGDYDVAAEVFPLGGRRGETVEFTLRGGTLASPLTVRQTLSDQVLRGTDWLRLDAIARSAAQSPLVAVGDLPERIWHKSDSNDPRQLDVVPPLTINSRLERKGDTDRFQFPVKPGQRYRLSMEAERFGSALDGVLRVTDQAGKQIALADDSTIPPLAQGLQPSRTVDPSVEVTVPADAAMLIIELRDQRYRGGINFVYRLTIEPASADFALQQPLSEVNVPRGGSVALVVPVTRRGYTGPIRLSLPNLPPGVSVQGGLVPGNAGAGVLFLSATAEAPAPSEPVQAVILGQATIDGQDVQRWADQKMVLARDGNVAAAVLPMQGFAVGLTAADPCSVRGPASLEIVKGYPTNVPVEVMRSKGQEMLAVQVSGLAPAAAPAAAPGQPPPAATVTAREVAVPANMTAATLALTAALNTPDGTYDLFLQGRARINNVDRVMFGSLITLTVSRPFTVESQAANLELPAGQTIALKGRIQRKDVCKEPVQLRVDGLPAGVTIAPLKPLTPDQTEFQIDLLVNPRAAAATANLTLTATATIGGQAFTHPAIAVPAKVVPAPAK
jgi:hypothetical protein